jgi:hypothetical protein
MNALERFIAARPAQAARTGLGKKTIISGYRGM